MSFELMEFVERVLAIVDEESGIDKLRTLNWQFVKDYRIPPGVVGKIKDYLGEALVGGGARGASERAIGFYQGMAMAVCLYKYVDLAVQDVPEGMEALINELAAAETARKEAVSDSRQVTLELKVALPRLSKQTSFITKVCSLLPPSHVGHGIRTFLMAVLEQAKQAKPEKLDN